MTEKIEFSAERIMLQTVKEHGLLFFGNQHETVPARLLFDKHLTSRAKLAWQLIKYKAKEFQSGLFPSYEVLAELLSEKTYADEKLSRKLISQTLLLLRLTRWLTLCETARNEHGQVMGKSTCYTTNQCQLLIPYSLTMTIYGCWKNLLSIMTQQFAMLRSI